MVYGLPERFGTRIHQHGFEATKRAENDVEEKLSMTAGGRRHLEHQYQLAMGVCAASADLFRVRPCPSTKSLARSVGAAAGERGDSF